jgi:hypothetical protein
MTALATTPLPQDRARRVLLAVLGLVISRHRSETAGQSPLPEVG